MEPPPWIKLGSDATEFGHRTSKDAPVMDLLFTVGSANSPTAIIFMHFCKSVWMGGACQVALI